MLFALELVGAMAKADGDGEPSRSRILLRTSRLFRTVRPLAGVWNHLAVVEPGANEVVELIRPRSYACGRNRRPSW